jgi:inner membrane protein
MDNLTHSLVGLTAAKAGLERMSPWATTVCVISANAADVDLVTLFFGDRWTLLQHHRGITHSILGTIAVGLFIPLLAYLLELALTSIRKRPRRIRFRALLLVSLIASATHPLLDWTNNYGVRPFLPWNDRWFYGDLVYIVDPYIWLLLGVIAFLLTSNSRLKILGWALLASAATIVIAIAGRPQNGEGLPVRIALTIWIVGLYMAASLRAYGAHKRFGSKTALVGLVALTAYVGMLGLAHWAALGHTKTNAANIAMARGERLLRFAAMPTAASFFRWQAVAETDQAMYRFPVRLGDLDPPSDEHLARYPKPNGVSAALVWQSEQDRKAQILLGFARFPSARVDTDNCVGQTLVQWADLRYTEPGRGRGNFSVNIPVDCPAR